MTADKNFAVTVRSNYFCQKLNYLKSFENQRFIHSEQRLRQLQQQRKRQPLDCCPIKLSEIYRFILLLFTTYCTRIYLLFQKIKNFFRLFKILRYYVIFACCGQNAVNATQIFRQNKDFDYTFLRFHKMHNLFHNILCTIFIPTY